MTNHQKRTKRNGIEGRTEGIPNFTFKQAIQLVVGFLLVFVVGALYYFKKKGISKD